MPLPTLLLCLLTLSTSFLTLISAKLQMTIVLSKLHTCCIPQYYTSEAVEKRLDWKGNGSLLLTSK